MLQDIKDMFSCNSFNVYFHNPQCKVFKVPTSPLHCAARDGQLEICQLIIENTEYKKTPETSLLHLTPLHVAAAYGHFEVYNTIMSKFEDKNPWILPTRFVDGQMNAFDMARRNDHEAICRLIESTVVDKN